MIAIGAGRIGCALQQHASERGRELHLLDRQYGWDALDAPAGSPVLVAVRNGDLRSVVERTPEHRRGDLLFLQNGMIRPLLSGMGLRNPSRGLLYIAVAKRGDPISVGQTTWFSGPHAETVAEWFNALELTAEAVDAARFAYYELEKTMWLVCFGLLCQAHEVTVGEAVEHYQNELASLVRELAHVARVAAGIDVPPEHLLERLVTYSLTIPEFRAGVKAWEWRDGWFVEAARRHGLTARRHQELLRSVGVSLP